MKLEVYVHVYLPGSGGSAKSQLDRMEDILGAIKTITEKVKMTQQEELALIQEIDAATTGIANNVDALATTQAKNSELLQTISNEVDQLLTGNPDVPAPVVDALQALRGRLNQARTASDAVTAGLNAQVPVLEAIASKGAKNPVPVPVPPPPPIPEP